MGAKQKKYRPLPPQVREAFERGDGAALSRMRQAGLRTLEERRQAEKNMLAAADKRIQRQREFQELARKRSANEHILPFNPEDEDLVPEEVEEVVPAPVQPADTVDVLDRLYEQFRPRGPVLVKESPERRRTPKQREADRVAALIAANELHMNPATGVLEPLSPPPAPED